jgi:hypothetical protein
MMFSGFFQLSNVLAGHSLNEFTRRAISENKALFLLATNPLNLVGIDAEHMVLFGLEVGTVSI